MSKRPRTNSIAIAELPGQTSGADDPLSTPDLTDEQLSKLPRKVSAPFPPAIVCSEKPLCNSVPFNSYEAYEIHYAQAHTNRCTECRRNFPTEHFLELHIRENHDPFWLIRMQRGEKLYGCFVEGCDKMCRTSLTRRNHLVDKHYFPLDYDWNMINSGIDKRHSMLASKKGKVRNPISRKSKPSAAASKAQLAAGDAGPGADMPLHELSGLMTGMKLVPRSIRFGRG